MRESKQDVFVFVGLGYFLLAFAFMVMLPRILPRDSSEASVDRLAREGIVHEFVELAERFPEPFNRHFSAGVTYASFAEALTLGRGVYVAEACWHCHTQQVRPVSGDSRRWGPATRAREYHNALQEPVLVGTRRVGPDLSREAARHGNDWHLAHFFTPTSVSPTSVMPEYKWFFDDNGNPNKRGLSIVAYMQWLGSRLPEYPYYQGEGPPGSTTKEVRRAGFAPTGEPVAVVPTRPAHEAGRPALMPIAGYLLIIVGIICLFVWAVAHGMLRDVERPKHVMLEGDARLERQAGRP